MRLILCLFLFLSPAALAQIPMPTMAPPAAQPSVQASGQPAQPSSLQKPAQAPPFADWKSLGKPMVDDSKPMKDRYVYLNGPATDQNISLERAIFSQNEINEWIRVNLAQILTLSGKEYDHQVYRNRVVFTPAGYADYIVYLRSANFAKFLKDNQYKVVTFVEGMPEIISEGIQSDAGKPPYYRWQVKTILVLSYLDYRNQIPAALFKGVDRNKVNNRLPVQANLEIIRIPVTADGAVIAINHLSFTEPEQSPFTESLDPSSDGL